MAVQRCEDGAASWPLGKKSASGRLPGTVVKGGVKEIGPESLSPRNLERIIGKEPAPKINK